MTKQMNSKDVPCNGCTFCCQADAVRLQPEDDPALYRTESHPFIPGALMLAHKPNGECWYLKGNGCSIHEHAPSLCRHADCRALALKFDFETARKLHLLHRIDIRVWDQGMKLLEKLRSVNT